MTEKRPEYLNDTIEMAGAGYDHPSIEIELPREVVVRRGERTAIEERAAFVKISTAFKDSGELARVDEIALKVWLFIALSVNRETGRAHPGLRTIAEGTGFAINTIRSALERLEGYGLLAVYRDKAKYNIYEPTAFVSARRETVSPDDTTVSDKAQTVSANDETVSPRVILNQRTREPDSIKPKILGIESAIYSGREVTEEDFAVSRKDREIEEILCALDAGLRVNCPRRPEWQSLARWVRGQRNPTLERWIEWYMQDDFRAKTAGNLTPDKIKMSYPQAKINQPAQEPEPAPECHMAFTPAPGRPRKA